MSKHDLVTLATLRTLSSPQPVAATIYVETNAADSTESRLAFKSAVDQVFREAKELGVSSEAERGLREQFEAIDASPKWTGLSRSLAAFVTPTASTFFVLPNALAGSVRVGSWFNVAPLLRAAVTPQRAFGLTLSQDGWQLWEATAEHRAAEMGVDPNHPQDVAEATNRATVRDRGHVRRLVGDEGQKVLLEKFARRVSEAVASELNAADPDRSVPLVIFGTSPLLELALAEDFGREVHSVSGASDQLIDAQIDEALRATLDEVNAKHAQALAESYLDGDTAGRLSTDPAELAKAAVAGAVDTLMLDFTAELSGELDTQTGDITFDDSGHNLLSQLALAVLETDGTVFAVRPDEGVPFRDDSPILARLRHPLA